LPESLLLIFINFGKNSFMDLLPKLNIPYTQPKLKTKNQEVFIFDPIRKKYVKLTPEEWVRQQFINYLIHFLNYPITHFAVEKKIKNYKSQRPDIVIYNKNFQPAMLIECKAPSVKIDDNVFKQIIAYATAENFSYLIITNGIKTAICKIQRNSCAFLKKIPNFTTL